MLLLPIIFPIGDVNISFIHEHHLVIQDLFICIMYMLYRLTREKSLDEPSYFKRPLLTILALSKTFFEDFFACLPTLFFHVNSEALFHFVATHL